jgi:hypothetical protein
MNDATQSGNGRVAAVDSQTGNMGWIPGGTFLMDSNDHYPEEALAHRVNVNGFWIDRHTVTNAEFARFVDATGYVTLAERPANPDDYSGAKPEMLVPSSVMFAKPPHRVDLRDLTTGGLYRNDGQCLGVDDRLVPGPRQDQEGVLHARQSTRAVMRFRAWIRVCPPSRFREKS